MLKDFNKFIYEYNTIYSKELNSHIILKFIEDFYHTFLLNNSNINQNILKQTANSIIVGMDDIILQNNSIKRDWLKKTSENKILHSNKGGEIFNNIIQDILIGRINNFEIIQIILILFILGVKNDYKEKFLNYFHKTSTFYPVNYDNNIYKSSIYKQKNKKINMFYIFIYICIGLILITEIHYMISLRIILYDFTKIFFQIRSLCGS